MCGRWLFIVSLSKEPLLQCRHEVRGLGRAANVSRHDLVLVDDGLDGISQLGRLIHHAQVAHHLFYYLFKIFLSFHIILLISSLFLIFVCVFALVNVCRPCDIAMGKRVSQIGKTRLTNQRALFAYFRCSRHISSRVGHVLAGDLAPGVSRALLEDGQVLVEVATGDQARAADQTAKHLKMKNIKFYWNLK